MKKLSPSWQDLSDGQWQEACRRESVIRPLAEQEAVSRQAAAAAAEQLGIGPALVYRLVARFRARPQTSSLAPTVSAAGRKEFLRRLQSWPARVRLKALGAVALEKRKRSTPWRRKLGDLAS
jgi:hypothetical protein